MISVDVISVECLDMLEGEVKAKGMGRGGVDTRVDSVECHEGREGGLVDVKDI